MRLTRANNKAIRYACLNFHYAKYVPVTPFGYNVYNDNDEWCGVILYSLGATINIAKPYGLQQGEVVELTRVALTGKQEKTSQALATSLKLLKKDCPAVRLVVSYADCDQDHYGTIYQATNWIYTGETAVSSRYFIIHGKLVHPKTIHSHIIVEDGVKKKCPQTIEYVRRYFDPDADVFISKGKRKYLMPLDKKMRKQIMPLSKDYPKKDENWHKIDRNTFKHQELCNCADEQNKTVTDKIKEK